MRHFITAFLTAAIFGCISTPLSNAPVDALVLETDSSYGIGSSVPIKREDGMVYLLTVRHVAQHPELKVKVNGTFVQAAVVAHHSSKDISLLVMRDVDPQLQMFDMDIRMAKLGERLFSIGFPGGYFQITDGWSQSENVTSAEGLFGSSGGAIIDLDGELIGIIAQVAVMELWTQQGDVSKFPMVQQVTYIPLPEIADWLREYDMLR